MLEVNIILGAAAIVCGIAGLLLLPGPPETRKRKKGRNPDRKELVRMKFAGMEDLPETPPEESIIPVTPEEIRLEEKLAAPLPGQEDGTPVPGEEEEEEEDDGLGGIPLQPFEL